MISYKFYLIRSRCPSCGRLTYPSEKVLPIAFVRRALERKEKEVARRHNRNYSHPKLSSIFATEGFPPAEHGNGPQKRRGISQQNAKRGGRPASLPRQLVYRITSRNQGKERETSLPCLHSTLHDSDLLLLDPDRVRPNHREHCPMMPSLPNILTVLWWWVGRI